MKKGFTLIELLVVIAIIGILSAVVLTSLNSSRQKAQDAKAVNDVKQVALAMELARNQTTGAFVTATSSLSTYLTPWPGDSIDSFAASSTTFCVSTTLSTAASYDYFRASEQGAGYSNGTNASAGTCDIN